MQRICNHIVAICVSVSVSVSVSAIIDVALLVPLVGLFDNVYLFGGDVVLIFVWHLIKRINIIFFIRFLIINYWSTLVLIVIRAIVYIDLFVDIFEISGVMIIFSRH